MIMKSFRKPVQNCTRFRQNKILDLKKALTKIGVIGDPRKAEAEKGEEYLELWAEEMVHYIQRQLSS